jgi:hypothetical protein
MMQMDTSELKKYENDLLELKARSLPFATRFTLHSMARTAQKESRKIVSKDMILRNKYTIKTIQFAPSSAGKMSLNINKQQSEFGSTEKYMKTQEEGGTKRKKGKEGVPIPTSWSAGQGKTKPRTKLPTRPNKMKNINLGKEGRAINKRQQFLVKVREALETKNRFFFHDFGGNKAKGIFKVVGGRLGKRRRGWPKGANLRLIYGMKEKMVVIPASPWMRPAAKKMIKHMPAMYQQALFKQLARLDTWKPS